MIGSGTFRFHKFSEEEKKPYRYNTNTNFYNSNTFNNFQKKRTFQSRLRNKDLYNNNINNINNNINLQSYQFIQIVHLLYQNYQKLKKTIIYYIQIVI